MGVNIVPLLDRKEVSYDQLSGKIVAVDSSNHLYQFLSNIRSRDGTLFSDSKGNVTSHLIGMLSRTTNLLSNNIKPIFVFDGKMPDLKRKEIDKRHASKEKAKELYEEAESLGDTTLMRKYASRTSILTKDMVEQAKRLASSLGCPIVQAASEAEAQAAFIVRNDKAYAVASQDADALLFNSPILLRNLATSGKKKKKGKLGFDIISPELIFLKENLEKLGLNQSQLICLGMLVGTDYNPGGVKGIGPKNAIKLVKDNIDPKNLFEHVKWSEYFDTPWEDVYDLLNNPKINEDVDLSFSEIDEDAVKKLLCDEHEFDLDRVNRSLESIQKSKNKTQKGLGDFF